MGQWKTLFIQRVNMMNEIFERLERMNDYSIYEEWEREGLPYDTDNYSEIFSIIADDERFEDFIKTANAILNNN